MVEFLGLVLVPEVAFTGLGDKREVLAIFGPCAVEDIIWQRCVCRGFG